MKLVHSRVLYTATWNSGYYHRADEERLA